MTASPKLTAAGLVVALLYSTTRALKEPQPASFQPGEQTLRTPWHSQKLWSEIDAAHKLAGPLTVKLPGPRTSRWDWVAHGLSLSENDKTKLKLHLQVFLNQTPACPPDLQTGPGVVILAGVPNYFVPAWVTVNMLRKTGSLLPVEMFFPESEAPALPVINALHELGVLPRHLPEMPHVPLPAGLRSLWPYKAKRFDGYRKKVAALVSSSFEQVLFLDADNIPVQKPDILFVAEHFQQSGAMLWPDIMEPTPAKELEEILNVRPESMPFKNFTFESGQMVFDKQRTWDALMLALYMNIHHWIYYYLLSDTRGIGDRNSFAFSLESKGLPYHVEQHRVILAGRRTHDWNAMVQHLDGQPFFLHSQTEKWNADIPADFNSAQRRWLAYGDEDFRLTMQKVTELDVEYECYAAVKKLRCAPWFRGLHLGRSHSLKASSRFFHDTLDCP